MPCVACGIIISILEHLMSSDAFHCPVCGESNFTTIRNSCGEFYHQKIVKCSKCSLVSLFRMPSEIYINKMNAKYGSQNFDFSARIIHKAQVISRIKYLEEKFGNLSNIKLLDVGSGYGMFHEGLIESGYRNVLYHAIDSDHSCKKTILKRSGASFSPGLNYCRESDFDLIICSHILEHLRDPNSFVRSLLEKTKACGCIFIEVPNQDYLYKPDTGAHLIFFSPTSLRYFLGHNDKVSVVDIQTLGKQIQELSAFFPNDMPKRNRKRFLVDMIKYYMPFFMKNLIESVIYNINSYRYPQKRIEDSLGLSSYGEDRQWIRGLIKVNTN